MESLPTGNECPLIRVTPLPIALYELNGLLFELYDGGQPFQPTVIRWERLKPVLRKDDINANEMEWSRRALQTDPMILITLAGTGCLGPQPRFQHSERPGRPALALKN